VGFPEEHDVFVIGIDFFVDVVVEGCVVKVDRAVLSEVAVEEGIEFIEEFITEGGILFEGVIDILFKAFFDFGVVIGFNFHEVDKAACAFKLCTDKEVLECVKEFLFFGHCQ
jgi:hypothetical protein